MIRRILLNFLKLVLLAVVAMMVWVQVPELIYDLRSGTPVEIENPAQLLEVGGTVFAVIRGTPDFTNAFVYRRYGLDHTYFTVEPYGMRLIVRTYDTITDEWKGFNSFVGRLRPFDRQPFSRYISAIYMDRYETPVPPDSYFLALDDVPKVSGWQVAALVLALAIWLTLFWLFFVRGKGVRGRPLSPP